MNADANAGWAERLGSTARILLLVVTAIFGVFAVGMVGGFSAAVIEDGQLPTKPVAWLIFAAMVALVAVIGWILATLVRSFRPQTMSGFDRRYWKMWGVIVLLGMPVGVALAAFGLDDPGDGFSMMLSNSPIAPLTAILVSLAVAILLTASLVIYFRTIDDHEERAYLWGTNIAFHFLALAFPLYWLLARGGLVPPITIAIALLIVLLSCIVQSIVWALFKFR